MASARIPLGPANLVTVTMVRAELGCRAELARRIVGDLRPRGPVRDRYLWAEVLAHPLVSDGEDDGDAPTLAPTSGSEFAAVSRRNRWRFVVDTDPSEGG